MCNPATVGALPAQQPLRTRPPRGCTAEERMVAATAEAVTWFSPYNASAREPRSVRVAGRCKHDATGMTIEHDSPASSTGRFTHGEGSRPYDVKIHRQEGRQRGAVLVRNHLARRRSD